MAVLVTPPAAGLAVAVVVTVGLLVPWSRGVATVGGITLVVAGCINVVQGQHVHHYLPGSNWDASFGYPTEGFRASEGVADNAPDAGRSAPKEQDNSWA